MQQNASLEKGVRDQDTNLAKIDTIVIVVSSKMNIAINTKGRL